jgi:hypothetical protein
MRESQRLSSEAEVAAKEGRMEEAARLYGEAAPLEEAYLASRTWPPRTRGIFSVSVVALYQKAQQPELARKKASEYLKDPEILEFARKQLEDFL